jgi:hypothetical protein
LKRLELLLFASLTLSGLRCGTRIEDYESEPSVFVVLSTMQGDSMPWESVAKVGMTVGIGDTIPVDSSGPYPKILWNGISGATVSVKHSDKSYVFPDDGLRKGYYRVDSCKFNPNEGWELSVLYPSGVEIDAQTRFPGSFAITFPLADTLTDSDSVLTWSRSLAAKGYMLWYHWWGYYTDQYDSIKYADYSGCSYLLNDTFFMATSERSFRTWGDSLYIWVEAFDSNAFDYFRAVFSNLTPEDFHKDGAWVLFGSQTVAYRKYMLLPYQSDEKGE